jgi:hypothetical protein
MKQLQITIYILFGFLLIGLIGNSIISISALLFENDILNIGHFTEKDVPIYLKGIAILKLVTLILFCVGIYYLIKILQILTKGFYFSDSLEKSFRLSGRYFILSGGLGFLLNLAPFFVHEIQYAMYLNFDSKSLYITLTIIGLFFYAFSKIIKQGRTLQQENELTI